MPNGSYQYNNYKTNSSENTYYMKLNHSNKSELTQKTHIKKKRLKPDTNI